ncbi:tyrosine-type recombinase/integrase [Acidaminococcus sp.]|uniref:tyrosine-type recombinase/integrase n=1 Tax=Acidaminococcus sp. TaxID=1872103 RepID=UPI003D7D0CEB
MEYSFSYREKNGSVCLVLSYKVGTRWKQKTKQGFKTQREARQHQDELLEAAQKEIGTTLDKTLKAITLRQFWAIFKRDMQGRLTYSSMLAYGDRIKRLPNLLDLPIKDITPPVLMNEINGLPFAARTKNLSLAAIGRVLRHAITYKIIKTNPALEVPQVQDRREQAARAFTREEVAQILDHYQKHGHDPLCYLVVLVASRTGMRIGEIRGLTWDCVDFVAGTFKICKQWARTSRTTYGLTPCKTKNSNRTIPVPRVVLATLRKWRDSQPFRINGTVFPPERLRTIQVYINEYIHKHYPGRSLHAFRHTYATLMLHETGDINLVANLLGDTIQTVGITYANNTKDIQLAAAKAVNDIF